MTNLSKSSIVLFQHNMCQSLFYILLIRTSFYLIKLQLYLFSADNLPYKKVGKKEPLCIVDEIPFDIPDSWEWARLGMISSYSHAKQKINAQNADPKIWELALEDIEKGGRLLERKTVGERKSVGDKTFFDSGDILYSKLRPYLLKILVAPDCGICTPEIVPFKMFGKLDPEYIVAFLKSPYVDAVINSVTYGVKMPRVGTKAMTELLVPIPPLFEQKRIVEKLSAVTPLIDSFSKAYVRAAELNHEFPEILKKSILQEAVQGKLVPQDPADEPASILLERIRAEKEELIKSGKIKRNKHESVIFRRDNSHYEKLDGIERCIDDEIPFDLPKSWRWVRLGCLLKIESGKPLTTKEMKPGTIPVYGGNGVTGYHNDYLVDEETVVIGRVGYYCGSVHITESKAWVTDNAFITTYPTGCIDRDYLVFTLRIMNLGQNNNATAQPVVSGKKIYPMLFPLPPLAEQKRIAAKLKEILPFCKTV